MSEEIIIDGVNVAGCEFLENENFDGLCLQLYDRYDAQTGCKNKDCYYKQLQRLKQVNKALKQSLKNVGRIVEIITKENEQLKKQLEFSRIHKTILEGE